MAAKDSGSAAAKRLAEAKAERREPRRMYAIPGRKKPRIGGY